MSIDKSSSSILCSSKYDETSAVQSDVTIDTSTYTVSEVDRSSISDGSMTPDILCSNVTVVVSDSKTEDKIPIFENCDVMKENAITPNPIEAIAKTSNALNSKQENLCQHEHDTHENIPSVRRDTVHHNKSYNKSDDRCIKADDTLPHKIAKDKTGQKEKDIPKSTLFKRKGVVLFKRFLVFLFSHVGLTCLVISYSILGAFIFQKLEQWNEKQTRIYTSKVRIDALNKLWNLTRSSNIFRKPIWTDEAENVLILFEQDIHKATKHLGWDGESDVAVGETQWTFTGSLLYSVTVITTIGYGHITPKTSWGRIITMVYAFFGIPLTLLCLTNIGALLGKGFLILYNKIPAVRRDFGIRHALPVPQSVIQHQKVKHGNETVIEENSVLVYIPTRPVRPPRHVPIVVCSLLVIIYLLIGTTIFHIWESSWDVLTSAYFCFITLSTIGFGDVVPGHSLDSWQSQPKQFLCTVYLLFGLTLLAMCFDLLQEQVRATARRFGEFIGIVDHEEDEYEEEINQATQNTIKDAK